jgi:hypothetical protein
VVSAAQNVLNDAGVRRVGSNEIFLLLFQYLNKINSCHGRSLRLDSQVMSLFDCAVTNREDTFYYTQFKENPL